MNRDLVQQLSKYTDDRTLLDLLRTNRNLYYNEDLLRAIFLQKYPQLRDLKKNYKSWRTLLLDTIRTIAKMKEGYGFDYYKYNQGNPKQQYDILQKSYGKKNMFTLLVNAINEGELSLVKFALDNGVNIHTLDDYALRYASLNGHLEIVKYLVENGADIHANEDFALRWASNKGHLEIVKYLVEHRADIHANNDQSLQWARAGGHLEVANYLSDLP